jgi:hypothetical protein
MLATIKYDRCQACSPESHKASIVQLFDMTARHLLNPDLGSYAEILLNTNSSLFLAITVQELCIYLAVPIVKGLPLSIEAKPADIYIITSSSVF